MGSTGLVPVPSPKYGLTACRTWCVYEWLQAGRGIGPEFRLESDRPDLSTYEALLLALSPASSHQNDAAGER